MDRVPEHAFAIDTVEVEWKNGPVFCRDLSPTKRPLRFVLEDGTSFTSILGSGLTGI